MLAEVAANILPRHQDLYGVFRNYAKFDLYGLFLLGFAVLAEAIGRHIDGSMESAM